MGEATVRLQALDGRWEEVGRDRYPGLVPNSVAVQSDPAGFATSSFELYRPDVWLPAPDLTAWTPCEIDEGEARLFEGRVQETPTAGETGTINVAGRGYQYAMDDNAFRPVYVHSNMADWVDSRQLAEAPLNVMRAGAIAQAEAQDIALGWPSGHPIVTSDTASLTLDLGSQEGVPAGYNSPQWIAVDLKTTLGMGAGSYQLYARTTPTISGIVSGAGGFIDAISAADPSTGGFTRSGRFAGGGYRYVSLFLYYTGGAFTIGADQTIHIAAVRLFCLSANEASTGTFFRSSDAVVHALKQVPELAPAVTQSPEEFLDEILAAAPARHYRLGNALDISGYSHPTLGPATLVVGGTPANLTYNATGGPLLDGTDSPYAAFAGAVYLEDTVHESGWASFTLGVWVKTTQSVGTYTGAEGWWQGAGLVSASTLAGPDNDWGLSLVQGRPHWGSGNPDQTLRSSVAINDGQWHYVALARDQLSGYCWLSVDGQSIGSMTMTNKALLNAASALHVGGVRGFAGTDYVGSMAELSLHDRYLSSSFPFAAYAAGRGRPHATIKRTLSEVPHMAATEHRTTRELVDGANALHRYRMKVGRDRVPYYDPPPSAARYGVGPWAAAAFSNASANKGDELYNEVLVTGTGVDGLPIQIIRRASQLPEAVAVATAADDLSFTNPSADTVLTPWQSGAGAPTRDTTIFHSGPASIKSFGSGVTLFTTLNPYLWKGRVYRVSGYYYRAGATPGGFDAFVSGAPVINQTRFGIYTAPSPLPGNQWLPFSFLVSWPAATLVTTYFTTLAANAVHNVDSLRIERMVYSVLDRRNMARVYRLNVGFPITTAIAQTLGDTFLRLHAKTPLSGSLPIGPGDLLDLQTGALVHPRNLVLEEGELIHFHGMPDPDTGAVGRDGIIAAVSYDPAAETAQVAIDNQRDNFETLLNRLAAVSGG